MNNKVDPGTRLHFRDWLRKELRDLDFYQRRGDHYLIREFSKYCAEQGQIIDEASLGRYLREDDPVLPTPERCRALARVFGYAPIVPLVHAGYLEGMDLVALPPKDQKQSAPPAEPALSAQDITALRPFFPDFFLQQLHDYLNTFQETRNEKRLSNARSA